MRTVLARAIVTAKPESAIANGPRYGARVPLEDARSPAPVTRLVVATEAHFEWAIRASSEERSFDGLRMPDGGIEVAPVLQWIAASSRAICAATAAPAAWLIVCGDEAVGLISLKSAPREGLVEIGYGVAPRRRGAGHATRAIAALLEIARSRGLGLVAETSVENRASQTALERNGFVLVRERVDPDEGALRVWGRRDDRGSVEA